MLHIVFFFALLNVVYSQTDSLNLVPNGGFEENESIPLHDNQLYLCKYWNGLFNSTDYFHQLSKSRDSAASTLKNFAGHQIPKEGKAYSGIIVFDESYGYKEYLQVRLKKELKEDSVYRIKFYLNLAENSYYTSHNLISFCLTDSNRTSFIYPKDDFKIYMDRKGLKMLDNPNNITLDFDSLVTSRDSAMSQWIEIGYDYKAVGGEKYLTIGIFKDDISKWKHFVYKYFKRKYKVKENFVSTYYYIDEVSIFKVEKDTKD